MWKILLALLLICLMVSYAWAANTETREGNTIMLVLDGATDWDSRVNYPGGLPIFTIKFAPSAAGDQLVVRHNGAAGNQIFNGIDVLKSGLRDEFPGTVMLKPYIKASEITLGTAANARVMLILK